jgi:hypothetical protein
MQYVGACSLLGRLSSQIVDEDDKECIGQALQDCATLLGTLEVMKTHNGYSLEPKS